MNWISVDHERKPGHAEPLLLCVLPDGWLEGTVPIVKAGRWIGWSRSWMIDDDTWGHGNNVTHWAFMPSPPDLGLKYKLLLEPCPCGGMSCT